MEFCVRISSTLNKRLEFIRRGGGNALQACEHARSIISGVLEGVSSPKQIGRLTRYGDARIPNCVKFDLVRGYRLVAVLGKHEISFLFVGSHDECDHWVRNNAGFELPEDNQIHGLFHVIRRAAGEKLSPRRQEREAGIEVDEYDAALLRELTDRDLRKIFSGLCAKRS